MKKKHADHIGYLQIALNVEKNETSLLRSENKRLRTAMELVESSRNLLADWVERYASQDGPAPLLMSDKLKTTIHKWCQAQRDQRCSLDAESLFVVVEPEHGNNGPYGIGIVCCRETGDINNPAIGWLQTYKMIALQPKDLFLLPKVPSPITLAEPVDDVGQPLGQNSQTEQTQ